jgi:beta-lactamase regulating signal transducer with metallopeptidase domain
MTLLALATFSSFSWEGMGMRLANHLWQSTVFGGVVWLLTLLLRKNQAQARCSLWLIASAKFLIPFSLLTGLGSHLARSKTPAIAQPEFLIAIETIGQPFSSTSSNPVSSPASSSSFAVALRFLPVFLLVAWLCGCLAVFCLWWLRWRRLRMARRAGLLAKSGRELEALRRVKQSGRMNGQIGVILSESALEPGILGVFHPVLLLPAGISERLNDEELNAILVHELCHVRRRDKLGAALHMLVEALFWFHPQVWWIGARLVDERERACDEEVLRLGAAPPRLCRKHPESLQILSRVAFVLCRRGHGLQSQETNRGHHDEPPRAKSGLEQETVTSHDGRGSSRSPNHIWPATHLARQCPVARARFCLHCISL